MSFLRLVIAFVLFWFFLFLTFPLYFVYILLWLCNKYLAAKSAAFLAAFWGKFVIFITGSKVIVSGKENLPKHDKICIVSNHQSEFDIPLILGYCGKPVGFIAKKELKKFPVLGMWMIALNCIFYDRKDRKAAVKVIDEGAENIRNGYPMVIFPEGTRSKSGEIGKFKPGSFKLALKSRGDIVPVTIKNAYKILKGRKIDPQTIELIIHKPVKYSEITDKSTHDVAEMVENIIKKPLTEK